MGRGSGVGGLLAMVGLVLIMSKRGVPPGGILPGGGSPAYRGALPDTDDQAEEVQAEMIRTRKITVHRTVTSIPVIPTTTQIRISGERIKEIDARIPAWVKAGWGKVQGQQGYLPKGEV